MHRIRGQRVRNVFAFYKTHNHFYMSIFPNEQALSNDNAYDDAENLFVDLVEDAGDTFSTGINEEQENTRGESETCHVNIEEDKSAVIERRMGLCDDSTPIMPMEHPATAAVICLLECFRIYSLLDTVISVNAVALACQCWNV
ncbi:hypothetical protein PC119_g15569 [Phytophthora cactorum]|nr:hypothetical protein PC119_g15569 [Phytophthora cactorum]